MSGCRGTSTIFAGHHRLLLYVVRMSFRIGLSPADEYTLLIMAIPVGDYYKGGMKPVTALVLDDYDRAAPLGVGHVKVSTG